MNGRKVGEFGQRRVEIVGNSGKYQGQVKKRPSYVCMKVRKATSIDEAKWGMG